MTSQRLRVRDLARSSGRDIDETLVILWDAGLYDIGGPDDLVRAGSLARAQKALGIPSKRDVTSVEYWKRRLALSNPDWESLLRSLSISSSPSARRLPKGALRRLNQVAKERGIADVRLEPDEVREEKRGQLSPLVWRTVGRERSVDNLSASDIVSIHDALVEEFARTDDPFGDPAGVRDQGLLESTAFRPATSLGDERKYKSVEMSAAALLHSIIHNHPFFNGNKRTALVAMIVMLDENGLVLTCTEDALFRFVIRVAQHTLVDRRAEDRADREVLEIAGWIRNNSRQLEHGDRPIKWGRLRQILTQYGCVLEQPKGVGNRMNIERALMHKGRFRREQKRLFHTQVAYGDEGRELDRNTLNKIRHDLELDEDHGVDSAAFYGDVPAVGDFIHRHAKILKRLARL